MARYRAQNGKMCFLCFMYFMCFFAAKTKKIWAGFDVFFFKGHYRAMLQLPDNH